MFEDQSQKLDDIFSDTDAAPAAAPPPAVPLGPPSALSQGKLQPVKSGQSGPASLPTQQLSGAKSSFPFKKALIIGLISLFVVGGSMGAFFWWRSKGGAAEPTRPSLGTPVETPLPSVTEPAETDIRGENTVGNTLNETYGNFTQGAVDNALDPFATSPDPSGSAPGPNESPPAAGTPAIDTDQDGLSDAQEFVLGTNPRLVDSDGDGLSDWEEISIFGTEPLQTDTDNDKYPDGEEVQNGYNPKGPGKLLDFDKAKSVITQ